MNIVDFPKKEEEPPQNAGERLLDQCQHAGLFEIEKGDYTMFFDTGDSIIILSNASSAGNIFLNLEKGKLALLSEVIDSET